MPNNFSGDPCKALYNFESGALNTDSKGGNTLVLGAAADEDLVNYKQGACSANFEKDNNDYYIVTDANLDAGFPLKNGDTQKIISVCSWIKPESAGDLVIAGKQALTGNKRSFFFRLDNVDNSLEVALGFNAGQTYETHDHASALTADGTTWYHVTVSYRDSDKAFALRVRDTDGNIVGADIEDTATLDVNKLTVSDGSFAVGAGITDDVAPWQCFDGNIDELVVFNKFLTADDATNLSKGEYGLINLSGIFPAMNGSVVRKLMPKRQLVGSI